MPASSIIIIAGSGGGRVNTEYGQPYPVAAGDTAENEAGGAVELHYSSGKGASVIPLAGYSGHQFDEAGTVAVYQ